VIIFSPSPTSSLIGCNRLKRINTYVPLGWTPAAPGSSSPSPATPPAPTFTLLAISAAPFQRLLSASSSEASVEQDRNITTLTASSYVTDYQLTAVTSGALLGATLIWESLDTNVATVDSSGFVTHVSAGDVTIRLTISGQVEEAVLTMAVGGGTTQISVSSYVSGSLARHIIDGVDTRLAGKSAATALRIFTSQDHTNQVYVRNPNVWCSDLVAPVLTCLSPWNSTGSYTMSGTLISPRHIIFAAHYQIATGATVRFVKSDGTVVNKVMTAKLTHPNYTPYYPDITIGVLDSDVPSDISFARILPASVVPYLPSFGSIIGNQWCNLPSLTLDQEEKALVTNYYAEQIQFVGQLTSKFTNPVLGTLRAPFFENKIVGDSGNPALLIINNTPVIVCVWTSGGAGSGTAIANHKAAINTMMTTLGGGYQLTEIDLSGFPTY